MAFKIWIKENRHLKLKLLFKKLNAKLRGYYNYYGIIGNSDSLHTFYYRVTFILQKWLNRRSQKSSYQWKNFTDLLKHYEIEKPRITQTA